MAKPRSASTEATRAAIGAATAVANGRSCSSAAQSAESLGEELRACRAPAAAGRPRNPLWSYRATSAIAASIGWNGNHPPVPQNLLIVGKPAA
jgi:hypothetical protein